MSGQDDDNMEVRKVGFYLESHLETMSSEASEQQQQQQHATSLADRRGKPPPAPLPLQLQAKLQNHRRRSQSVPTLESLKQSRSIGDSLKQFGDDYVKARSPVKKTEQNQTSRRRSSADIPRSESTLFTTVKDILYLVSGAGIESAPSASNGAAQFDEEQQ